MELRITKNTSNCIKFIAAIMVAFHHYSQMQVSAGNDNIFYFLCSTQGGYLGVAIFFFLSGYGLMESEQKKHLPLLPFIRKRLLKVYIPVFFVTILWATLSAYSISNQSHLISFFSALTIYVSEHPVFAITNFCDGVLWFVKVILKLYIVFYIFTLVWNRNKTVGISLLWIGILAVCLVPNESLISIPIFGVGVMSSIYKKRNYKVYNLSLIPLVISALIVCCYCIETMPELKRGIVFASHALFNYLFIGLGIICLTVRRVEIQFPTLLGMVSYDIYLVHNKILISYSRLELALDFWIFIALTLMIAFGFYYFRTSLTKINNILWENIRTLALRTTES